MINNNKLLIVLTVPHAGMTHEWSKLVDECEAKACGD